MHNCMYAQLLRFSRWGFGGGAFFKRHLPQRKLTAKHFFDKLSGGMNDIPPRFIIL